MTLPIRIASEYAWNILAATAMSFQCLIIGGMVGGVRRKYGLEYPDMGNGRFSEKLTDDQWKEFNNYQRAHQNYVEGLAMAISFQLFAGLFYPRAAAWSGLVYIIGRQLYAYMYQRHGPKARLYGALLLNSSLILNLGLIIYGSLRTLGYMA